MPSISHGFSQPLLPGQQYHNRLQRKMTSVITGAFRHQKEITSLKEAITRNDASVNDRGMVGMSIRRWEALGGQWRLQALFALLVETMNNPEGKQPILCASDSLTVYQDTRTPLASGKHLSITWRRWNLWMLLLSGVS